MTLPKAETLHQTQMNVVQTPMKFTWELTIAAGSQLSPEF